MDRRDYEPSKAASRVFKERADAERASSSNDDKYTNTYRKHHERLEDLIVCDIFHNLAIIVMLISSNSTNTLVARSDRCLLLSDT